MDKSVYNSIQAGFGGKKNSITRFETDDISASRNFTITTNKLMMRDSDVWKMRYDKFQASAPDPTNSVLSLHSSDNDSPFRPIKSDFNPNESLMSGRQTTAVYPKSIEINNSMTVRKGIKTSGFA